MDEINLFAEYEKLRKLRAKDKVPLGNWLNIVESTWNNYPNEWLLLLNLYEIGLLQDYKGEAGPWLEDSQSPWSIAEERQVQID